jgi:hypothetical protein
MSALQHSNLTASHYHKLFSFYLFVMENNKNSGSQRARESFLRATCQTYIVLAQYISFFLSSVAPPFSFNKKHINQLL